MSDKLCETILTNDGNDSYLPDDQKLLDRVQLWGTYFDKYRNDTMEYDISLKDIPCNDPDEEIEQSETDVSDFEDNSIPDEEQDPCFDIKETLNNTLQLMEQREHNWRETGMDKAMMTFNVDVAQKVQNWMQDNENSNGTKDRRYFRFPNWRYPKFHKDQFVPRDSDSYSEDESLESVNTAKYILSSRKKSRTTHFTTTTIIKQFCFTNRQQNNYVHLQNKFDKKYPRARSFEAHKSSKEKRNIFYSETKNYRNTTNLNRSRRNIGLKNSKYKKKNPDNSDSFDSSSTDDASQKYPVNNRKKVKHKSFNINDHIKMSDVSSLKESTVSDTDNSIIHNKKQISVNSNIHSKQSESAINFNIDSIINSTEINNYEPNVRAEQNNMIKLQEQILSNDLPCDSDEMSKSKSFKSNRPTNKMHSRRRILDSTSSTSLDENKTPNQTHISKSDTIMAKTKKVKFNDSSIPIKKSKKIPNSKSKLPNQKNFLKTIIEESNHNDGSLNGNHNVKVTPVKKRYNLRDVACSDNLEHKNSSKIKKFQSKINNHLSILEINDNSTKETDSKSQYNQDTKDENCKSILKSCKNIPDRNDSKFDDIHSLENFQSNLNSTNPIKKIRFYSLSDDNCSSDRANTNTGEINETNINKSAKDTILLEENDINLEKNEDKARMNGKIQKKNTKTKCEKSFTKAGVARANNKTKNNSTPQSRKRKPMLRKSSIDTTSEELTVDKTPKERKQSPVNRDREASVESFKSNCSAFSNKSVLRKSFCGNEPHLILYEPDIDDDTLIFDKGKIVINKSFLQQKIGADFTTTFLNGRKWFKRSFSSKSTIIFIFPQMIDSDSSMDTLDITPSIAENKFGKIIEVTTYKDY